MRRQRAITSIILACLFVAPSGVQAYIGYETNQSLVQFDFWGFSIAPDPANPGDMLELVGVVNEGTTYMPIDLDFRGNEYTVYIHGLSLEVTYPNGPLLELHFDGGMFEIYEDPSFNAPFTATTNPDLVPPLDPQQVPSTFTDGTLLAQFAFRDFIQLFYEYPPPANYGIGTIAYTATELRAVGGAALPELRDLHLVIGWHLGGGYTSNPSAYIPEGYGMRYDPSLRWENPLPVESATWGGVKALFHDD